MNLGVVKKVYICNWVCNKIVIILFLSLPMFPIVANANLIYETSGEVSYLDPGFTGINLDDKMHGRIVLDDIALSDERCNTSYGCYFGGNDIISVDVSIGSLSFDLSRMYYFSGAIDADHFKSISFKFVNNGFQYFGSSSGIDPNGFYFSGGAIYNEKIYPLIAYVNAPIWGRNYTVPAPATVFNFLLGLVFIIPFTCDNWIKRNRTRGVGLS